MIDNVRQLVGGQPQIQRVQYSPVAGNGEVEFQMPVAVPTQRTDPVARLHFEFLEYVRQTVNAPVEIGVRVPVHRSVVEAAGNFFPGVQLRGTFKNVLERQRVVHHETSHDGYSVQLAGYGAQLEVV